MLDWVKQAQESKVPQLMKMAVTFMAYRTGIPAWYDCPISTGKAEGINNKIKVMKRMPYGFRDEKVFSAKAICAARLPHHSQMLDEPSICMPSSDVPSLRSCCSEMPPPSRSSRWKTIRLFALVTPQSKPPFVVRECLPRPIEVVGTVDTPESISLVSCLAIVRTQDLQYLSGSVIEERTTNHRMSKELYVWLYFTFETR